MTIKKTLTVAALLAASSANAAGFYLGTQGARATGMGQSIVAHVDDSSAVFYNPAGILGIKKLDIAVGDTGIIPRITFTPGPNAPAGQGVTQGQEFGVSPPPHLYAAYRLTDKLAVGVGLFVPFAARTTWEEGFVGSDLGSKSRLAAWHVNPTIAFQPHERVKLGVGASYVRSTLEIERDLNFLTSTGNAHLGGFATGFGFNAGAQVDIIPKQLSAGITYRSQVSLNFEGNGDFQDVPAGFESRLVDQVLGGSVRLPTTWAFGLAGHPTEKLLLAADLNWQRWSDFPQLFIDFGADGYQPGTLDAPLVKDWEDTFNFHLGGEYAFTDAISGRLGFVYDPTPAPTNTISPDLPDADRIAGAIGFGYKTGGLKVDLAYQFVKLLDTESTYPNLPGTYGGAGHVLAATIGYAL